MFNTFKHPKAWEIVAEAGSGFSDVNRIVMPTDANGNPGTAVFIQVWNQGDLSGHGVPIQVRFNDDAASAFTLYYGDIQSFGDGDLYVTSIDFAVTASGGMDTNLQILAGVVYA